MIEDYEPMTAEDEMHMRPMSPAQDREIDDALGIVPFTIRMSPTMHEHLIECAKKYKTPPASFVRKMIARVIAKAKADELQEQFEKTLLDSAWTETKFPDRSAIVNRMRHKELTGEWPKD